MTTNGEEDVRAGNDGISGDVEARVPEVSCDKCRELTEELQKRKKEHTVYTALKKKISLTDSLIKKYNSKCQEFDQQQKKLQDVTLKLASTKGDCKVLEEQLTVTLKEIIPWKCDKNKFLKEYDECKKRLSETEDKLNGSEALCIQFESKLAEMEDKLVALQDIVKQKKTLEKGKQMEKKASAYKEDLVKCRKELKATKSRESSLVKSNQKAKNKISELVQILHDHGFSVPKIPKSLRGGTADSHEGTSNEDTEFETMDEVFSQPQDSLPQPKQESPPEEAEHTEERRGPHPQEDACHKIFERFSTSEMVNCMSPLPPSPQPSLQDEVLSDLSSNMSEDDARDDETFSDVADEINNLMEVDCHWEKSQGGEKIQDEGRSQADEEPPDATLERSRLLSQVYDDLCDDSEGEITEKPNPDEIFSTTPNTMPKKESLSEAKPASEELFTGVENEELRRQGSTSSQDAKDCDLEGVELAKQKNHSEKELTEVDKSRNVSPSNVSGKASKKRNPDTEVFTLGSSLSEESEESDEDGKASPGRKPSENPEQESPSASSLKTLPMIQRNLLSPVQNDLDKLGDAGVKAQNKLLLSPDQRMTRSQLKMLASLGDVELTGSSDSTLISGDTRENSHLEKISPPAQGDGSVLQDRKESKSVEIKLSAHNPEKHQTSSELSKSHTHQPCRRPFTRSLSHSETESCSETVPPSPSKSLKKRALRFSSVTDTDLSSLNPLITSDVIKTEPELSTCLDASSPTRHSPRRLLHSVSLTDDTSVNKTFQKERQGEDSLLSTAHPHVSQTSSQKMFLRSSSVPGETSSGKRAEDIPRRITRSQKHCLGSPPREEMIPKRLTRSFIKRSALKTKSGKPEILSQTDTSRLRANNETPVAKKTTVAKNLFDNLEPVLSDDYTNLKSKTTCGVENTNSDNSLGESAETLSQRRTKAASGDVNSDDKRTGQQEGPFSRQKIDPKGKSLKNKAMLNVAETEANLKSDAKPESIGSPKSPGRSAWKASSKVQEHCNDSGDESLFESCSGTGDNLSKQNLQDNSHRHQPSVAKSCVERVDPLESDIRNRVVHAEVPSDDSDLPFVDIFITKKSPQGKGNYLEDFKPRNDSVHEDSIQDRSRTCSGETNPGISNPELKPSSTKRTIFDGEEPVLKKPKLSIHTAGKDEPDSKCFGTMTSESTDALPKHTSNEEGEVFGDKAVPDRSKLYQNDCQVSKDYTEGEQVRQSILKEAETGLSEDSAANSKVRITKTNKGRTSSEPIPNASREELTMGEDDSADARPEHTLQGGNTVLTGEESEGKVEVVEDVETNQVVRQDISNLEAVVTIEDVATASIKRNTKEKNKEDNKPSLAVSELTSSGAKFGTKSNSGDEDADLDDKQQNTAYKNKIGGSTSGPLEGSVKMEEESAISFDELEQDVANQAAGRQEDPRDTSDKASSYSSLLPRAASQLERFLLGSSSSEQGGIPCNSNASQVVCVEAESSRASTPTTDVLSINSMSGHVSPVSPLSFHELDRTSPLSPLASAPHSPLVSPLSPSQNIFDSFVTFPRILSPLPPSPGTPELELDEDTVEPSAPRGVVSADVVNRPRMISPLFSTPVPPVVSPLLEPPIPSVLSPLSETSPQRLGDLALRDRSPMISPLRNPLIPSPCNFHAEAPRDALSVRPQHLPVPRRQPASRCLAASFTIATSPPGMSQAPEIISPRLHSLASELSFEFGESQPSTSGFQRQRLSNMAPSAIHEAQASASDKVNHEEKSQEPEEKRPTSVRRGFQKIHAKPESAKNEAAVEKLPETSIKIDRSGQNKSERHNLHEQTQKKTAVNSLNILKTPKSPERENDGPPKTRSRIKQKFTDEAVEDKMLGKYMGKKAKTSSEYKNSIQCKTSEDTESEMSKRCTRSRSGAPTDPNLKGSIMSSEKNTETILKSTKRRKNSRNRSGESEAIGRTIDPGVDGCRDAFFKKASGDVASAERASLSQPVGPSTLSERRPSLLIPAVEVKKVSGFKKSGSLRKMQDSKQEPEALARTGESDHVTDAASENVKATLEDQGNSEGKPHSREPKAAEKDFSIKTKLGENNSFCQNQPHDDGASASGDDTNSYKDSPEEKCDVNKRTNQMLSPTLIAGGSQQIAPTTFRTMSRINSQDQQATLPKAIQVKSNIGIVWGNIASRKEPRFDLFNRGKKNKVRAPKADHGESEGNPNPRQNGNQEAMRGKSQSQSDSRKNNQDAFSSGAGSSFSPRSPPPYQRMETQTAQRPWSVEATKTHLSDSNIGTTKTLDAGTSTRSTNPTKTLVPSVAKDLRSGSDKEKVDLAQDLHSGSVRAAVSKQSGSTSLIHGMQSGPGGVHQWTLETAGESPMQTSDILAPARSEGDMKGRKRRVVGNSGGNRDEQPSSKLQKIMTSAQPMTLSRSGVTQPDSDVNRTAHYSLEALIHRIKELRSDSAITPVIAEVINFLGNSAVSLMPSILAKCRSGNTSLKAMLLPHEQELVSCIMESVFSTTKSHMGMLMTCLSREIQQAVSTESHPRVVVGAACCRMLAALGRKTGVIERIRVLCYDIVREDIPDAAELLLNVAVTWTTVLKKKVGAKALPLCSALEMVTMERLANAASTQDQHAQQMMSCFQSICGWTVPSGNSIAESCCNLLISLQDVNITKFYISEKSEPRFANLTSKSYELVKTVELYAQHLGWEWTNDYLIREKLWPLLKIWSQGLLQATSPAGTSQDQLKPDGTGKGVETPADASACAVMKIIGSVASLGLKRNRQSVYEILKMLAGVLQQPTESVPLTVQFCTAEAVLSLSPSNPTFALAVLQQWEKKRQDTFPSRIEDKMRVLTKIACAASGASTN